MGKKVLKCEFISAMLLLVTIRRKSMEVKVEEKKDGILVKLFGDIFVEQGDD